MFFIIRILHLNRKKSAGKENMGGYEDRVTRKKYLERLEKM